MDSPGIHATKPKEIGNAIGASNYSIQLVEEYFKLVYVIDMAILNNEVDIIGKKCLKKLIDSSLQTNLTKTNVENPIS